MRVTAPRFDYEIVTASASDSSDQRLQGGARALATTQERTANECNRMRQEILLVE